MLEQKCCWGKGHPVSHLRGGWHSPTGLWALQLLASQKPAPEGEEESGADGARAISALGFQL